MASETKVKLLEELKTIMGEDGNFVITTYSGLNVATMSDLRRQVRAKNGRMKVVKNNIFRLALKETGYSEIVSDVDPELHGPIAVTFSGEDYPAVSKVLVEFAKTSDFVEVKAGGMDGKFLPKNEVTAIATLPSKDELLAIIGRGLNTPATKIAMGLNEVITKLARGINAVADKQQN